MLNNQQTNLVPNGEQQSIFAETFSKLFKENKESNMFDRFSSLSPKEQMLAVSAASAIFPVALTALAIGLALAVPGVIVGLALFFTVKAVEYGFKGLKWSAEKTIEGAKYIAKEIEDASTYIADKIEEGYEHSVDSLKRGASFVGEGVANKFHRASGKEDYLNKIKRFTPDGLKKSDEIRNDMKEIFADKGNDAGLVKNILSGISSKIDLKIAEEIKSGWIEHTPDWQVQREFINNLNEKSLRSLLTEKSLPKGSYFIDSVFSEHYDEVREVIKECKENHLYSSVSNMFNTAERKANRPSFKSLARSTSSFSTLGRKSSEQSSSLSESSVNSIGTVSTASSTAELLNPAEHKEVKTTTSFGNKVSSWLRGGKAPEKAREATDVEYQALSESGTMPPATIEANRSHVGAPIPVDPPKVPNAALPELPRSNSLSGGTPSLSSLVSNSSYSSARSTLSGDSIASKSSSFSDRRGSNSGFNSPSSSPKRLDLSPHNLSEARSKLRRIGSLNELAEQPSSKVAINANVQQQAAQTAVKS